MHHQGEPDTPQDERQLIAADRKTFAIRSSFGCLEYTPFQSHVVDRQPIVIPLDQLDGIAAAVDENEHTTTGVLVSHEFTYQPAQSVEALAEVRRTIVPELARIGIDVQHGQPISSWRISGIKAS